MTEGREPGGEDADATTQLQRAQIARELVVSVRGLPPADVPSALCRACTALLPDASGVSVSVRGEDTDVGILLCASDDVASYLADIQYTLGEGPCTEAVRLMAPVFATDLTRAPDARRWPLFSLQAAKAGAEAVFSLPLAGAGRALGTLDLYRETAGPMSTERVRTALLVADALTLAVTALDHASADRDGVVTWLEGAESDREEIYQATGMIMVQVGVSAEEALLRLRARAYALGRTSSEVARQIVDRTLDMRDD
ncbi:GAF and ANTAR domain-containing protein [Streptomyces sp. NPDC058534]|uniref:GAF and ANTAR domain-containing protein n=1 Tax=Streptomyces sp. NPDC058534 TaxID=3346541 RepID=UPI003652BCE9